MKLTNGFGQEIKPEWIKRKLSMESIHENLQGLQRLEISRANGGETFWTASPTVRVRSRGEGNHSA